MPFLVFGVLLQYVFGTLMTVTATFLILLILVQRGRGGGLTGALGGMGGQSAFGTKAGDLFTRVTMVVATIWILLSVGAIAALNSSRASKFGAASSGAGRTGTAIAPDSTGSGDEATGTNGAATSPGDAGAGGKTDEATTAGTSVPAATANPDTKGPVEKSDLKTGLEEKTAEKSDGPSPSPPPAEPKSE